MQIFDLFGYRNIFQHFVLRIRMPLKYAEVILDGTKLSFKVTSFIYGIHVVQCVSYLDAATNSKRRIIQNGESSDSDNNRKFFTFADLYFSGCFRHLFCSIIEVYMINRAEHYFQQAYVVQQFMNTAQLSQRPNYN